SSVSSVAAADGAGSSWSGLIGAATSSSATAASSPANSDISLLSACGPPGVALRRRLENGASTWEVELPEAPGRVALEAPGGPAEAPVGQVVCAFDARRV